MTTTYIAVRVDDENNAGVWWDALRAAYPAFARALERDGAAVSSADLWTDLVTLPGFAGGPAYAPTALIDCGPEGDRWADVVGGRHSVFENLS
jgi:hypothetical protein